MAQINNNQARESIAKIKFKLFIKNFKKNWALFRESKMGMFGLWAIIAFGIFGALSPIVLNILDPNIYDPVTGLDSRILSSKYITDYLSTQNIVKGIEIPTAQIWVYSFMDKGEAFKTSMENVARNAQYDIMTTYAPDSMRHFLDTIADSYIPAKERLYFQNGLSELINAGLIKFSSITSPKDVGNRDKFSFQNFSELLQKIDHKTLAIALSPYADSDEVSRVQLWYRSLNRDNDQAVEEFNSALFGQYSEDELKQAQQKVIEIAKSIAGGDTAAQLYVQSDQQLAEVIENEIVDVSDLVNSAVMRLIPELLVLAREDEKILEQLKNSKFVNLIEMAEKKLSNLNDKNIFEQAYKKAKTEIENITNEMKSIGIDQSYEEVEKFLELYAGMQLAKVSVDIGVNTRAKLENQIAEYSDTVHVGFVYELNDIFKKIAIARTMMSKLLNDENVPDAYEMLGSKVIKVLSDPVTSLMAYAFGGTNKLSKVTANIENSQLDDFKRIDIVDKLKKYENKEPIEAASFLIGEGDINEYIYQRMVDEHKMSLNDASKWDEIATKTISELSGKKTSWSKEFAEKKLVELFNTLSLTNKIGVGHPLPPSRWHWLGTDPVGRDIFVQLMVSTPSEFVLGVLAALITVVIGTIIGTAAAYYGGVVDVIFMRIADIMMLFPSTAFLIVLSGFMTMNLFKLALILGLLGGFGGITLVLKAQALTIKVKPYIDAARVSGGSHGYIIFNHIIPNVMPLSFLYMMFNVTGAVFSEAVLSFFGLMKVRMSWGLMINTVWSSGYLGSGNIGAYWWMWVPAGGAITLLCSAFYFLGRGLEEIVNPRLRKR
ncbi:MAG: ABC transporter permease subunit [Fervidobacterium sp.]|uniref:ABC-type dipeptide/oligopeptide/nickel transport system, permease component n=1 Tax=Fervidobacterium gondwanense DSM 13020 TaxID=1121883 RepID=A0A1M7T949_FERGO|nr:ABC transporter permease subunit [Fervidobacterium gondwanense]SHN67259.1 ABC-type dipeptide/oligopeptide/nickel transport system, permease component [Fervidobacterium gondwanense DSM 13020]